MRKCLVYISIVLLLVEVSSCHNYSFTGANTSAKTMHIDFFENKAANAPANIGELFTDKLKEKFGRETSLVLKESEADLNCSGFISAFAINSEAATSAQTSAVNRLTIKVKVQYYSAIQPDDKWEQEFSRFSTYSSSQELSSVQSGLIEDINTQLVDDIFTKALVKW